MGVERVNSRVYTPVRSTTGKKLDVDAMLPADEVPQAKDEEAREKRYKRRRAHGKKDTPDTNDGNHIDEHI